MSENGSETIFARSFAIPPLRPKLEFRVATLYKRKAQRTLPVNSSDSDGTVPGGRSDWRERAIAREKALGLNQPREEYDRLITPKFSDIPRGSRLTPERIAEMKIGTELWPEEKVLLLHILYNREKALAWQFSEMAAVSEDVSPPIPIRTIAHEAWQAPSFPVPKALTEEVRKMVRERLNAGTLEFCHGPYRNPWFLVKKKDKGYRMINAAMNMNKVTIRDANLPPESDEFAEEFAGMPMTSLIDWFSGYDQVLLHEKSRDLTAFMTPEGLVRQTRLPMGATNSVAQFCRVGNKILKEQIPKKCRPFVDDIGVKGLRTTLNDELALPGIRKYVLTHLQWLDDCLCDIERSCGVISGAKSQWCMPGIKIVGYVCDSEGRHPDTGKVIKILEWPPCEDILSVRAFLGVCVYYRIWIRDFTIVAKSLYQLLIKDAPFRWDTEQQESMDRLKEALTTAPALRALDYDPEAGEIILAVDASCEGWGAVLMQVFESKKHPNRYESGLWNRAEKMYDAGKRECRGLLKALKKCRHWLYGIKFTIELDANTLVAQLNRSATDLPGALVTRWLAWIRLFDFDVRHVSGRKHTAADGLSRRPRTASDDIDEQLEVDIDDWIDGQLNCVRIAPVRMADDDEKVLEDGYSEESQKIASYLTTLHRPPEMCTKEYRKFVLHATKFLVREKQLFRRMNKSVPMRRVVDDLRNRQQILKTLHDQGGHRGKEGTYQRIAMRYFWPNLMKDVKAYVASCEECQRRAPGRQEESLHPTWTMTLWQKVAMDIVYMPSREGKRYLILARCDFSGWVEGRAIANADSETVAKFFYQEIICRHGCVGKIVVDGGPENQKWLTVLAEKYRIKKVTVSGYHPQANGMVERGHTPVVDALTKMTEGGLSNWVQCLHTVLWADRTTVRASTGMTPIRLLTGSEAVLPIELEIPTWQILPWKEVRTTAELLALRARQLSRRDEDLEEVRYYLERKRKANQDPYGENHRIRDKEIAVEDLVLLHDTRLDNQHSEKLAFRWLGPFRIHQAIIEKGTYILKELDGAVFSGTVPGNRLKKFISRESIQTTNSDIESSHIQVQERHVPENELRIVIPIRQSSFEEKEGDEHLLGQNVLVTEEQVPTNQVEVRIPHT